MSVYAINEDPLSVNGKYVLYIHTTDGTFRLPVVLQKYDSSQGLPSGDVRGLEVPLRRPVPADAPDGQ